VRVRLEARLVQRKRRLFMLAATAHRVDSGELVAEAEAGFMLEEFGSLAAESA
jgi:acyl-coenzyme A thioesterase PaaI-like protein